MPKLLINFALTNDKPKGVPVGSAWKVPSIEGISFKWKGKVKNDAGELVDISGRQLIEHLLDIGCFDADAKGRTKGLLLLLNTRKREGKKDPDYSVLAYPTVGKEKAKK